MKKYYVFDTNVLMLDSRFYDAYEDGVICIPTTVVQELDKHKGGFGNTAINTRRSIKLIGKISENMIGKVGSLVNTIKLESIENREFLIVEADKEVCSSFNVLSESKNDDLIISSAISIKNCIHNAEVVVVSNDANVRVKTNITSHFTGVTSMMHQDENVPTTDLYVQNWVDVSDKIMAKYWENNLMLNEVTPEALPTNTHIYLCGAKSQALGKVKGNKIIPIDTTRGKKGNKIREITPAALEQYAIVDAMRDEDNRIVAIIGRSGSGKSLISTGVAVSDTLSGKYSRMKVIKPYVSLGNSVGYLKGTLADKLEPIKASVDGVLEMLGVTYEYMEKNGKIEFATPEFERGVTYHNMIVIVEEAQNLTPHEIKSIATRCGETSKVVFVGDIKQVDNQYLTSTYNGMSHLVDRLVGKDYFTCVYLDKSQRAEFINDLDEIL
ncbi:MAG: PhoH family protein [Fusobacteriaceae bacterium]